MRNLGSILGYALIAYQAIAKGQQKISANPTRIAEDLANHAEVIAEGVQTILRRYGVSGAYEQLKSANPANGSPATISLFYQRLIPPRRGNIPSVRALTPQNYAGYAAASAKKKGS